jgi:hypothetical protein
VKHIFTATALLGACAHLAVAQVAILHIRVVEGEGAVNAAGSHTARPLAVEVTDETGKPVEGASVSFHLPDEGPGGMFGNGLRTDVTVTDPRGRAALHTMTLNRTPGRFAIRIVASKEQARAGMVTFQYVADTKNGTAPASSSDRLSPNESPSNSSPSAKRSPLKWVVIAVLAGGAAAAGAILAGKSGSAASQPTASVTSTSTITIGNPTLSVGKP